MQERGLKMIDKYKGSTPLKAEGMKNTKILIPLAYRIKLSSHEAWLIFSSSKST